METSGEGEEPISFSGFPFWIAARRRFKPDDPFFAAGNVEQALLTKQDLFYSQVLPIKDDIPPELELMAKKILLPLLTRNLDFIYKDFAVKDMIEMDFLQCILVICKYMSCIELDNPLIVIYEKKISSLNTVMKVLELAMKNQRTLLIISEDVESEALAVIIFSKLRAGINVSFSFR